MKETLTLLLLCFLMSGCRHLDEITAPLKFLIKLPKGINDYRIFSSKDFFFFYPKGQMVYIQVYPHKESERSMIPGDSALKTTDMYQVLNKLNDINGWEQKFSKPNANRKAAVIHIDEKSKIILYNVLSQNKSDWEGLLTSFHYLD
ncbi:hypothetical protein AB9P05_18660 [Roseivirga sp. BDSF3-8]|uniref:hypothetical protein n=1 Tax=Roseivirga sp. BDSF3-8 TaxID=3241598 RepID=UPI0035319245